MDVRDAVSFRAILAGEPDGPSGRLVTLSRDQLPDEAVTVRVGYSSLNYKDGLAVTGRGRVVRRYPMVCGVDLAGEVEESADPTWGRGDQVIATGHGLGEEHWGGFSEVARVRPDWLVRVPERRDARWAMSIGTAGLTAMFCVLALERHGATPELAGDDPVVVTGAAGGVGSVAVALLAELGYKVVAVSGRPEQDGYLRRLGASEILPRSDLADAPPRPLDRERFFGGVDAVGGTTLATVLRQTRYGGCVSRLRPRRRRRAADDGSPVHPPRRDAGRHRVGTGAARAPRGGVGPARGRTAAGVGRRDDDRRAARARSWTQRGDPRRPHPGPGRDRRQILTRS